MNQRIYLDNAATTPLLPEVIECINHTSKNIFGNPSSIYREGAAAKSLIEESRKVLSKGAKLLIKPYQNINKIITLCVL